jgi:hypothetical protein
MVNSVIIKLYNKKLFFVVFLMIFAGFVINNVFAGYKPPFGGEYINVCGSGLIADQYNCSANCNLDQGSCTSGSGQYIYAFVCDGKKEVCLDNGIVYDSMKTLSVRSFALVGSNKTVQLDVTKKSCMSNGQWICGGSDLLGFIVWYSGTSTPVVPPQVITLPPVATL